MMREMKDSGMPWIGVIPAHWRVDKVKYHLRRKELRNPGNQIVLSVYREYGVIPKDSRDDNHNVTSEDVSKYKYVKPGCLVINKMKAWQGSMGISEYEGIVSPAYFIYEFTDDILTKQYLHHLFRTCYRDEFRRISGGIREGQWDLSPEAFGDTLLPVPPVDEQRGIAAFLDVKCAEIDVLAADVQAHIDTLEQYKRSVIFKTISHGIYSSKLKQTDSDVWTSIPEDWELVDIKYLFRIVKRIAGNEGYDILAVTQKGIRIKDISNNEGQIASDYSGYQFVYPTDYVMNHMDLLTGWVDCSNYFGVTSPDYRVFCLQDKEANDLQYYKYVMQCCYMCRIFYSLGQGVSTLGRWRLQTESFLNFKVPVPPLQTQKDIARYLDGIITEADLLIDKKKEQLTALDSYKKSLIYEYVTGKKEIAL